MYAGFSGEYPINYDLFAVLGTAPRLSTVSRNLSNVARAGKVDGLPRQF
jgi:hypothetical protein